MIRGIVIALCLFVSGLLCIDPPAKAWWQSIQQVAVGGTSFTPPDISGLKLWLDGANAATVHDVAGVNVSQWDDSSGNGNNATQSTALLQPSYATAIKNGKNAVGFLTGTGSCLSYMDLTFIQAQPFTVFGSTIATAPGTGAFVFDDTAGTSRVIMEANDASDHYLSFAGSSLTGTSTQSNVWVTWVATFNNAGTSTLYINGVSEASGGAGSIGANNFASIRLACRFDGSMLPLNGYIGEVGVYNSVISGANLTNLSNYLIAKWSPP